MNSAENELENSEVKDDEPKVDEAVSQENIEEDTKQVESAEEEVPEDFEAKCKDLEDQMLRLRAEQENFRRAQFKETEKKVNIAIKNVVTKFLTVRGDFDLGIQSAEQATDVKGVLGGMKMVDQGFKNILSEIGVEVVSAEIGQPFDANFHQPLTRVESDEHPENSILSVISKGYTLKGMLVQPAMVTVSCEPKVVEDEKSESETSADAESDSGSE
ncbi:MAG: nucleotide exchange factor GrpE [Planctomycetota bacterium]|nr:MAG: nucleotide exchange factor GrpE [Planctomycetota bacterium]